MKRIILVLLLIISSALADQITLEVHVGPKKINIAVDKPVSVEQVMNELEKYVAREKLATFKYVVYFPNGKRVVRDSRMVNSWNFGRFWIDFNAIVFLAETKHEGFAILEKTKPH